MKIDADTKIATLLETHPFLEDFLIGLNPRFSLLKSGAARATLGRVATVKMAASVGGMDPAELVKAISEKVERHRGQAKSEGDPEIAQGSNKARAAALKGVILSLHEGASTEEARRKFAAAVADVSGPELAQIEEELIREGLPVSEVQRLCDIHVGAFKPALDSNLAITAPPGHPVHTYMSENEKISELAERFQELAAFSQAPASEGLGQNLPEIECTLKELSGVEVHYARKENQLFPFLEKHGVSGPSRVMWGVHDEIRGLLRTAKKAAADGDLDALSEIAPKLCLALVEMVYKEEKILFPMSLEVLSEEEWAEARLGEPAIGYPFGPPKTQWPSSMPPEAKSPAANPGLIDLKTGALSPEVVDLMLIHLPLEISLVDESDTVIYYSDHAERIFPRSPAVIGRKVQNCHPEKSLHMVDAILEAFKSGRQDVADFWMDFSGRFLHIRYIALRDREGRYRGCMECTQDVTGIRRLEGERRLLQWEDAPHQA